MSDFSIPTKKPSKRSKTKSKKQAEPEIPQEESEKKLFSEEELLSFWDCMLNNKPYTEDFDIRGFKFTLKSRESSEISEVVKYIDSLEYELVSTSQFYQMEANMAVSVLSIKGENFQNKTLSEKIESLRRLPAPVSRLLASKVTKFDSKIFEMSEEVSSENF